MSAHTCVADINALLAPRNTHIEAVISMSGRGEYIPICTMKNDSKKRGAAVHLYASFCPFCGIRLNEKEVEAASGPQAQPNGDTA